MYGFRRVCLRLFAPFVSLLVCSKSDIFSTKTKLMKVIFVISTRYFVTLINFKVVVRNHR